MSHRRIATVLLVLLLALAVPATGVAVPARTSLTAVEADVMCVACHEPLAVAQSPQAESERSYILLLIQRGETKAQIERELVVQYGESVLAKPPARGFSLSLYILPPAIVIVGLVVLAVTLPRWRRRSAAAAGSASPGQTLAVSPGETKRLDDELSQYRG